MLLEEPVTVPRLAVARAWEWEQIGPAHPVLGIVDVWFEDDVSAKVDDLIRQALAEPGFYDLRRQRIVGEFRDLLLGIANAESECYCFSAFREGQPSAVLATYNSRSGLLITVNDDLVTLERIPASRALQAVVDTLPDCRPAGIREFSVARSEYSANLVSEFYSLDVTSDYTLPSEADQLRTLMASRRGAVHQFYVAARANSTRSSSLPLTVVDTADTGRVLTFIQDGASGDDIITCGPGSAEYITATLDNTMSAVRS
ncbi:ESX secretion-associated protein EspG [Amycolatopsis sp. FDAARGOS 1241]|uniref:ESX secretion-associated protein EspG n=1 Tax=Amycolatopsis sp. FDAARGOS 1241 TaxID=2778070 RepID=UPI00194E81CC|nr:ESX secretion-associated protein EspG [Amycolatopsis sp. FDAARGOS 1241]QRP48086.1 ESX secretion-associated protein EspG [Amycolatopsis sp. FDAARGOS 1241]